MRIPEEQMQLCMAVNRNDFVELSLRYRVVPLTTDNDTMTIGISEQSDIRAVTAFRFATGKNISIVMWEDSQLQAALAQHRAKPMVRDLQELVQRDPPQLTTLSDELKSEQSLDNGPLVHFIHRTLQSAIAQQASDVHFEPYTDYYRVRFRIDGVLCESPIAPPQALAPSIAARLKIISGLDIAERRLPQDGRLTMILPDTRKVAMRVATLPTRWGEKVVLRLLDGHDKLMDTHQLGMPMLVERHYHTALDQPQGLILITGPTGSGKTVTLYSGLQRLNRPEKNICTAEDPIEIPLSGINQLQINIKANLTFDKALRAFLRQDPDVIMLGEIRDRETADMAVKAAQTGHLVLSTLHTNSAVATLTRMVQMGIPRYQLVSALKLIVAQRLVRKLCIHCRCAGKIDSAFQKQYQLSSAAISYHPHGCSHCNGGYQGRVGVYEALVATPTVVAALLDGANETVITQLAIQQGMQPLQQAAIELVLKGETTIAELHRVLGNLL